METKMLRWMVGGMWAALGLGACMGQDPVVGANRADADLGGAPATEPESPGIDGRIVDQSIQYLVSDVIAPDPGQNPAGFCMPWPLPLQQDGLAACRLLRTPTDTSFHPVVPSSCSCDGPDYALPEAAVRKTAIEYLRKYGVCSAGPDVVDCEDLCLCELIQTGDARRSACLADGPLDENGEGWCYIAPGDGLGPPEAVADCSGEPWRFRWFGADPQHSRAVLTCGGVTTEAHPQASVGAPLGSPCLPLRESRPNFAGFSSSDVTLDVGTSACASGMCLMNHFEGRVSCPYGQLSTDLEAGEPTCFVPQSDLSVTQPVATQRLARRAEDVVTCSCQCDGPGPGPYCACPSSMVCAKVIDPVGVPAADAHVGSYCIRRGTEYATGGQISPESCADRRDRGELSCGDPRPY